MIKNLLRALATEKQYPAAAAAASADFAAAQIAALPPLPRAGVYALALLFYCHYRLRRRLPVARWRSSPLPPCRDFILLCDSLLAFYRYGELSQ